VAAKFFNTDQGALFTRLDAARVLISMDGGGRWLDNVFVQRLWRSLKYEEAHLKA
jgi:putative transposase